MALRSQVPKFGNWENEEDVPYTAYFEKAKENRHAKTKPQIPDPSSKNEPPFQDREEVEIKRASSEPERLMASRRKEESRVSHEAVSLGLTKSSDTLSNPRKTPRQSGGSDRSFDSSPMHSHPPARSGNRGSAGSSEGNNHGPASSTPGRSRLKQSTRGDESVSYINNTCSVLRSKKMKLDLLIFFSLKMVLRFQNLVGGMRKIRHQRKVTLTSSTKHEKIGTMEGSRQWCQLTTLISMVKVRMPMTVQSFVGAFHGAKNDLWNSQLWRGEVFVGCSTYAKRMLRWF